jgi:hypothetical protein
VDTRGADGPFGGPALLPTATRTFTLTGSCQIPPTAKSISLNVTVTAPTAPGHLALFPAGTAVPSSSTINFRAGQTRANNALISVGPGGAISVFCGSSGSVHLILDVNGYFQ